MKLGFCKLLVVVLSCVMSFAQMIPVTSTIRTPYGNVKHTTYTPAPYHHYGGGGSIKFKQKFEIKFFGDSTVTAMTKIKYEDKYAYLMLKDANGKKQKFIPRKTVGIKLISEDGDITGIPADSCWLFKVVKGKINGYAPEPETGIGLSAIQKGEDGSIMLLTKSNLMPMIAGDEKAIKLATKNKLVKAVEEYNVNH